MSCSDNELLLELQAALEKETEIIERIRACCADPDVSWVDDADNRPDRISFLAQASAERMDAQAAAEALLVAWRETRGDLPESVRQALATKRKALDAAIAAVRRAEARTRSSKGALLRSLTETNQTQGMLGAYGKR